MRLEFTVPSVPVPKKRHRTVPLQQCLACQKKVQGQYRECPDCGGAMRFLTNVSYADSESVRYENLVAYCAREAMQKLGIGMFEGPVRMSLRFTFPIPESRRCRKHLPPPMAVESSAGILAREMGCKKVHIADMHAQRPDLDNLTKSVLELQGVMFADDCIVSELTAVKVWGNEGKAEVVVESL